MEVWLTTEVDRLTSRRQPVLGEAWGAVCWIILDSHHAFRPAGHVWSDRGSQMTGRRCAKCSRRLGIHATTGHALRHFCCPVRPMDATSRYPEDLTHWYGLNRIWGPGRPALWILANPSTADGEVDDPTIAEVCTFTENLTRLQSVVVMNLYSRRATDARDLREKGDLVGDADVYIEQAVQTSEICIVGWGRCLDKSHPHHDVSVVQRIEEVLRISSRLAPLMCLGYSEGNEMRPWHPLHAARMKWGRSSLGRRAPVPEE